MGDVRAFREEYRKGIPRWYLGWAHFAFTSLGSLTAVAFAASRVQAPVAAELATIPLTFLFANAAEYFGHKGPMHHAVPGLRLIYRRHTLEHHHFFTEEAMACDSARDFRIMLFPPILLVFFLGAIAGPIGAALFLLLSANVGWLFIATAVAYFLTYEWLHFCYHLSPESRVGRLGLVRVLRRHHATHHELAKMQRWNFNITFPICDSVFGTTWRG